MLLIARGLGLTCQTDTADETLGSIAIVGRTTAEFSMWRLGDRPKEVPDFAKARKWQKSAN